MIQLAEQQRLSFPPLWSFSADLSFPSSPSDSSLNSNSEVAPFSLFAPILSSPAFTSGSKGSSFGFLSLFQTPYSNPSHIFLSICLGVQAQSSNGPFLVPVWNLNTTVPLKQQGKTLIQLRADDSKQLSLVNGDGSVVWSLSNADSIEMKSNGNLVIFDSRNESVWQSFDYPTDSLLQGQRLRVGMEMTSSNNMYKAVMQSGGVVLYQVSANPLPLVYWIHAANTTVQDNFRAMVAVLSLNKDAPVNLTSSLSSPSCENANQSLAYSELDGDHFVIQDTCANIRFANLIYNTTTLDYVRLDSDGYIRDYHLHQLSDSSYTLTTTGSNYRSCFGPNVCGPYGICSSSNTFGDATLHMCRCPAEEDNKILSNVFSASSNPSEGCKRKTTLNCKQLSAQSLVEIRNVAYLSMLPLFELSWEENTKSLEDCKASCYLNCSCSGLLYHTGSSFCLPFGDTTPLSKVSFLSLASDEHIAFVKVQLSPEQSKLHTTKIVTAVILPLLVIIIILSAIYWKWKKHMDPESKLAEEQLLGVLPMLPTRYSYRDLTKFTEGFTTRLGSGGFGSVYKGLLPDGRRVAVKNLELLSQGQKEFLAEIATIGGISHVNIVNLHGFCLEKRRRLLVYEYMENGSLDKWLFCKEGEQRSRVMSWETRYNAALGTARGLAYLHEECPKPILHFDVKPQNILLDGYLDAKLGDFGLAKLVARDESSVMTAVRGTPGYIAPEWVSHLLVSNKCDVYSFGMVLLELVSGRKNVEMKLMGNEDWYFPEWAAKKTREGKVLDLIDKRLGTTVACGEQDNSEDSDALHQDGIMEQVNRVVRVALSCIHEEPDMRPNMTMVCGMLEGSIALPNDIPATNSTELPAYEVRSSGIVEVGDYSSIQGR